MTIQKVFLESIHLWIVPLVLVALKVCYDILPKTVFFGLAALAILAYVSHQKAQNNLIEKAAKELEESADTFLDELDASEKAKKEKEAKKKILKEQQRKEKQRAQEKQQRRDESQKSKGKSSKAAADSDEDDDDMLLRLAASQQKGKAK